MRQYFLPQYHCGTSPSVGKLAAIAACTGSFAHGCSAHQRSNGLTTSTKVHAYGGRPHEAKQDNSASSSCTSDVGWDIRAGSG
jgi:hypothetical protein